MALHEITVPRPIIDVAINAENSRIAILQEGIVSIAELDPVNQLQDSLDLQMVALFPRKSHTTLQIGFQGSDEILVATYNSSTAEVDVSDVTAVSHLTLHDVHDSIFLSQDGSGQHCFIQHRNETSMLGTPDQDHQRSLELVSASPKKVTWIQVGSYQAQVRSQPNCYV